MKINVWETIVQLSKERHVGTDAIVDAIKESLRVASQKYFTHGEEVQVSFVPEKGEMRVFAKKKVVDSPSDQASEISLPQARSIKSKSKIGDSIELDLPSETLGRIAAQAAKQVIVQKVRDAEQEEVYAQFSPRKGEIVTGVLRRFEANKNMILELDKDELFMPYREKLPNEDFVRGDRVKAVIIQVLKETRGAQVVVSRTAPQFLAKLMELEIPEIADGLIQIKDIVRQPGERAKVAVSSNEEDIDPIGACIGVKGNRILAISKELKGEKIDVIAWSDRPLEYAKAALSPARIENVIVLNKQDQRLQALVSDDQYSLAIGKKGMNVRLASRLVGWKIEIGKA